MCQRNRAPLLNHWREIRCCAWIEIWINPHRLRYFVSVWKRLRKMGSPWRRGFEVRSGLIQIDTVQVQDFIKFKAVDDCQRVKMVNAGCDSLGFNVRESVSRDQIVLVVVFANDTLTCSLNIAHSKAEFLA